MEPSAMPRPSCIVIAEIDKVRLNLSSLNDKKDYYSTQKREELENEREGAEKNLRDAEKKPSGVRKTKSRLKLKKRGGGGLAGSDAAIQKAKERLEKVALKEKKNEERIQALEGMIKWLERELWELYGEY